MLIQGYRRGRAHTLPDRDLYVLAQAVVTSFAWLAIVWLVLLAAGNPIEHWGLVPWKPGQLEANRGAIAGLALGVELIPFGIGLGAGSLLETLRKLERARGLLGWTGLFEPPTAWEQAWAVAETRVASNPSQTSIEVSIRLRDGSLVEGRYGEISRADLSPRPRHQLYLETAYGVDDRQIPPRLLGDGKTGGVFIDASEIVAVYFKS